MTTLKNITQSKETRKVGIMINIFQSRISEKLNNQIIKIIMDQVKNQKTISHKYPRVIFQFLLQMKKLEVIFLF